MIGFSSAAVSKRFFASVSLREAKGPGALVATPPQKDRQRQVFSKTARTAPGWLSGIFPTHFPPISHFYSLVKELGEENFAGCGELIFFAAYYIEIID